MPGADGSRHRLDHTLPPAARTEAILPDRYPGYLSADQYPATQERLAPL